MISTLMIIRDRSSGLSCPLIVSNTTCDYVLCAHTWMMTRVNVFRISSEIWFRPSLTAVQDQGPDCVWFLCGGAGDMAESRSAKSIISQLESGFPPECTAVPCPHRLIPSVPDTSKYKIYSGPQSVGLRIWESRGRRRGCEEAGGKDSRPQEVKRQSYTET